MLVDPIISIISKIIDVITGSSDVISKLVPSHKNRIGKELAKILKNISQMKNNSRKIISLLQNRINNQGEISSLSHKKEMEELLYQQVCTIDNFYRYMLDSDGGEVIELLMPELRNILLALFDGRRGILLSLLDPRSEEAKKSIKFLVKMDKKYAKKTNGFPWIPYAEADETLRRFSLEERGIKSLPLNSQSENIELIMHHLQSIIVGLESSEESLRSFITEKCSIDEII